MSNNTTRDDVYFLPNTWCSEKAEVDAHPNARSLLEKVSGRGWDFRPLARRADRCSASALKVKAGCSDRILQGSQGWDWNLIFFSLRQKYSFEVGCFWHTRAGYTLKSLLCESLCQAFNTWHQGIYCISLQGAIYFRDEARLSNRPLEKHWPEAWASFLDSFLDQICH